MKSRRLSLLIMVSCVSALFLFSECKSTKEVTVPPFGESDVLVYCSGPDYFTNNEFFRANSVGESVNQAQSKRMALSNARAELAGNINVLVSGVVDNYFKQAGVEERSEFAEHYEGVFREVVDERLSGLRTICERVTQTNEGRYKTYIAVELSGNEIIQAANQRISQDERLRLDYDFERFKKTFEEEIEKLRRARNY